MPLPLPVIAKLLWSYRKWIAIALAVLLVGLWVWRSLHNFGERRFDAGVAQEQAAQKAREDKATAEHNAKIARLNDEHAAQQADLQKRLDAAIATPVVRRIRVPVASVCPPASPSDAGVPVESPNDGHVDVVDEGYGEFRAWLLHYGAGTDHGR